MPKNVPQYHLPARLYLAGKPENQENKFHTLQSALT